MNKIKKAAVATAATGAFLYFGLGATLCAGVLSRSAVNKSKDIMPEDRDESNYKNPQNTDDWAEMNRPVAKSLINLKGESIWATVVEQQQPSSLWLICSHGYNDAPKGMGKYAKHFYDKGYNVLLPYLRAHVKSEHKTCTMGYFDRYDIVDWINYIVSCDPNAKIVLLGVSMGAATTLLTTGENLPDNVKCAVADCAYTSCWDEFTVQIKELFHLSPLALYPANTVNKIVNKWDFKKCSPFEAVARSKTPTLFIHGEKDTFVPYRMMNELFNNCSAEKDKLSVPEAKHGNSVNTNPELYWAKTDSFVAEYI